MSNNRLFIYDPLNGTACPIAKGYSAGWFCGGNYDYLNNWFDENHESVQITAFTRYQLATEDSLPLGTIVSWSDGPKIWGRAQAPQKEESA